MSQLVQQSPDGAVQEVDWVLPDPFLLRVAGLPLQAAQGLRFPDTAAWADSVLELERELAARTDALVETLEGAIADQPDRGTVRTGLINLKRDVFNGRRPRPRNLADAAEAIDDAIQSELDAWQALWDQRNEREQEGAAIVAAELETRRAHLRGLAQNHDLRAGILLQSTVLYGQLGRYVNSDGAKLDKRTRRVERTLLEYVYRAACKTSPFSTLASVALGEFVDDPDAGAFPAPDSYDKRSFTRLNVAILARISAVLMASDEARGDLIVRVTSGAVTERERVRYVRRRSSLAEDSDAAVTIDPVHENLFYLPSGTVLQDLLRLLPQGQEARFGDVVQMLTTASAEERDPAEVEIYLRHLVRLGLLVVPALQIDIHSPHPLHHYRERIARIDRPWAATLVGHLEAVEKLVEAYAGAATEERRRLLQDIHSELESVFADLGRPDVGVLRTLMYEDTSLPSTTTRADRGTWERTVVPELQDLARLLLAFDPGLPKRLTTKGFFRARYQPGGTCEDLLAFAHQYQQDFFDPYSQRLMRRRQFDNDNRYVAQENWFKLPEIAALDAAREAAADHVVGKYAQLPVDAEELVLGPEFVEQVASLLPAQPSPIQPWSFFAQLAKRDGDNPRLVLNQIYSGLTLLFSRFAHCFPEQGDRPLAARLRQTLEELTPPNTVFAELRGGFDATNLNLHPRVTAYELVCPGEVSFRPAEEQIGVEDLEVRDDVERDELMLWSRRLDCQVIPVYLGFLLPMALPELQQVLLTFSVTSMAQMDLWAGTTVALPDETIVGYPRIRYGDVVLHRRMWKMNPNFFPHRETDQDEHDYFLEIARWREAQGLPRRVFVTPDATAIRAPDSEDEDGEVRAGGGGSVSRKPLYVDFDSVFSVALLERVARSAVSRLVIQEMSPGEDELWVGDGDESYVSEFIFELDGVKGRESR